MAKMTMIEFSRLAAQVLALPKRNRHQLEELLCEKREEEGVREAAKALAEKEATS